MHYSNKTLKPTTTCVVLSRKVTHVTGIKRTDRRFIDAMFVSSNLSVSATSHQHEPAQKKKTFCCAKNRTPSNIVPRTSFRATFDSAARNEFLIWVQKLAALLREKLTLQVAGRAQRFQKKSDMAPIIRQFIYQSIPVPYVFFPSYNNTRYCRF